MTRVPGSPVDSTSFRPTAAEDSTPTGHSPGGLGGVVEYHGTRFYYGHPTPLQTDRGSLMARQLAKIAARLAALKRRIAARRQRRGMPGGGDDDFDGEFLDGGHGEHRRAEAGGGAGEGGGGSGGQSHHDEHGGSSRSGDPTPKVEIKPQNIRPVRDPTPGALMARLTAQSGLGNVKPEQVPDAWIAALLSQRDKLAADPNYRLDVEYFDMLLDLLYTKEQIGPLQPQGMSTWREKLKALVGELAAKRAPADSTRAASDAATVPASRRELTKLENFHALLPLIAMQHDAVDVPSRRSQSKNRVTTLRNAALARQSKR